MSKLPWESLPADRVAAVQGLTGPVIKAESATGGLMPGLAAVLHTEAGRYFLKAVPTDSPAAPLYEREMAANAGLAGGVPAPRMRFASDDGGWLVMAFDYLEVRDADLSPRSPDLDAVLTAITAIGSAPAWGGAPPVAVNIAGLRGKSDALFGKQPSGRPWEMYRAAIDGFDADALAGDSLVHYDLHPGNLKVTLDTGVAAVDWAFACAGAPWADAALIVPRLVEAGHTPATAERFVARLPAWCVAPPDAVTALAALWTMFREYKAIHGPVDTRAFRQQAARAGRNWVEYRMS